MAETTEILISEITELVYIILLLAVPYVVFASEASILYFALYSSSLTCNLNQLTTLSIQTKYNIHMHIVAAFSTLTFDMPDLTATTRGNATTTVVEEEARDCNRLNG